MCPFQTESAQKEIALNGEPGAEKVPSILASVQTGPAHCKPDILYP